MEKYYQSDKYIKITNINDNKTALTNKQRKLVEDLFTKIGYLQKEYENIIKSKININIFTIPLVWKGGESSSLIEGTRTMTEDFSFDIEEINNIPQWEVRNLVMLYEDMFLNDNFYLNFDSYGVSNLHSKMYSTDISKKFNVTIELKVFLDKIKPGNIMKDDNFPNFIGSSNKIEEANLILLKPSLKTKWLDEMFTYLKNKIDNNEFITDDICKMHPIFEAIHPFRDGNGRIGRMLLTYLFRILFKDLKIPFDLSESFSINNSKEYKEKLRNVQLKNDAESWNEWNYYFINSMIDTAKIIKLRINKIIQLWNKYKKNGENSKLKTYILEQFFKYFKINRSYTIKKMRTKFPNAKQSTLYENFNSIIKELNLINENGYYEFSELIKIFK